MTRFMHADLSPPERVQLARAHLCQEARALLLAYAPPGSPQARRVADALARLTDALWPEETPRRKR